MAHEMKPWEWEGPPTLGQRVARTENWCRCTRCKRWRRHRQAIRNAEWMQHKGYPKRRPRNTLEIVTHPQITGIIEALESLKP
jgi:hypothetical protein